RSRLRFELSAGRIWLDENRMLLTHAKALGALRKELVQTVGMRRARRLFMRMGFVAGQIDADLALKMHNDDGRNFDVFQIGPGLHGFEGVVKAKITEAKIDWENGDMHCEVE